MDSLPTLIQEHFGAVAELQSTTGPLRELVAGLAAGTLSKAGRRRILKRAGVSRDELYRKTEIDLVLSFIEAAIAAASFGPEQRRSFGLLKELFDIREGEFLRFRPVELATLLGTQLEAILADNVIDPAEDEYQAALQDALDLGFDQYMALCRRAFENASRRLQDAMTQEMQPSRRADLQHKLDALAPMIRLAEVQQRTLGALY
jgi:hypothetical protein